MAEIATDLGVDIRLETSVEELLLDGKKVLVSGLIMVTSFVIRL